MLSGHLPPGTESVSWVEKNKLTPKQSMGGLESQYHLENLLLSLAVISTPRLLFASNEQH